MIQKLHGDLYTLSTDPQRALSEAELRIEFAIANGLEPRFVDDVVAGTLYSRRIWHQFGARYSNWPDMPHMGRRGASQNDASWNQVSGIAR